MSIWAGGPPHQSPAEGGGPAHWRRPGDARGELNDWRTALAAATPPPPPSTFDRRSLFPAKAGWPEGPPSHIFEPAAEAPLQKTQNCTLISNLEK